MQSKYSFNVTLGLIAYISIIFILTIGSIGQAYRYDKMLNTSGQYGFHYQLHSGL